MSYDRKALKSEKEEIVGRMIVEKRQVKRRRRRRRSELSGWDAQLIGSA